MTIKYNITGAKRKAFAKAIGEILGEDVIYNRAPTFSYIIADYTIDKHGNISCPSDVDCEEITDLIADLKECGYHPKGDNSGNGRSNNTLTIEFPKTQLDSNAIENLQKIIAAKNRIIKKALATAELHLDISDDKLCFPWFTLTGADGEVDAYSRFVCALCEMAKRQKRVTAKECKSDNEKFDMRVFLIRLGFIGTEYKSARKILLRNLTGNGSYKYANASQQ